MVTAPGSEAARLPWELNTREGGGEPSVMALRSTGNVSVPMSLWMVITARSGVSGVLRFRRRTTNTANAMTAAATPAHTHAMMMTSLLDPGHMAAKSTVAVQHCRELQLQMHCSLFAPVLSEGLGDSDADALVGATEGRGC